jgi:hypothetical protein
MSRGVRIALSLFVTLLLLAYFLRGVDVHGAWRETRAARPAWLGVCLAGAVLHYVLRAVRWRWLLDPAGRPVRFTLALSCTLVGYFLSAVLPGRPGEVVRPVLLGARAGISRSFCLATVFLERAFLDPLALAALLALGLWGSAERIGDSAESAGLGAAVRTAALTLSAAIAAAAAAAVWLLRRRQRLLAALRGRAAGSPRLSRLVEAAARFAEGLSVLRRRRVWTRAAAGSLVLWAAVGLGLWGGMRAFRAEIGYLDALVLSGMTAIGVAIPTPGGAGGFHVAMQVGLTRLYGVPAERSAPAALFTHLAMLLPALTAGAAVAWRHGVEAAPAPGAGGGCGRTEG